MNGPLISDGVLLQMRRYGFSTQSISFSDSTRSYWGGTADPHQVAMATLVIHTYAPVIKAISKAGQATAPEDSLPWYLQNFILQQDTTKLALDIEPGIAIPESCAIRKDQFDPDLYHVDLVIKIPLSVVIPEEPSLTHKLINPKDEDIINPTKVEPMKPKISRPKKWV